MGDPSPNIPTEQTAQLRIGNYNLGETLGTGTFGKVKVGCHQYTRHKVAIKILNRQKIKTLDVVAKIRREIQNMKLFRHPHIIKLYQVISTPTDVFMIMEYLPGGELFDYIVSRSRLSEAEARKFFQQIMSGVDYCHRHRVVHRDLKPENLLLDKNNNVKVADFGLSNMMSDGEFLRTSCGSPNYAAPEVISGKLYAGPEVDVWSCGVILYALLCGTLPFDDDHVPTLFRKIKSGLFSVPEHLNPAVIDLLKSMLKVNPIERATIEQIKQHEWYKKDLPTYLQTADETEGVALNEELIQQLADEYKVPFPDVHSRLMNADPHDELVMAYQMHLDNMPPDEAYNKGDFYLAQQKTVDAVHPEKIYVETASHPAPGTRSSKVPPRGKWHLGIRSQSRPQDIMFEVYRAMKHLGFEWKVLNSYHVHCRKVNPVTKRFVLMSMQLYQIDQKSYLLDFKSLNQAEHRPSSVRGRSDTSVDSGIMESDDANPGQHSTQHSNQTIEFFEMCSELIAGLAT